MTKWTGLVLILEKDWMRLERILWNHRTREETALGKYELILMTGLEFNRDWADELV